MVETRKSTNQVRKVILKAREGSLELDELHELWPSELEGIDLFDRIYDDVEDSVEHQHIPWGSTPSVGNYAVAEFDDLLQIDLEIISLLSNNDLKERCREDVIQKRPNSVAEIRVAIDDFFQRQNLPK